MNRRALVASYYVPQPDRDSGARRLYDFILFLREAGWQVDFVAANGIPHDSSDVARLQQLGVTTHDDAPVTVPNSDGRKMLNPGFAELLQRSSFDVAILAFWPVAEFYLPVLRRLSPATRVIVDSIDLHFLREARHAFRDGSTLDDEFAGNLAGEWSVYAAADVVTTVSAKEGSLLTALLGESVVAVTVPDCEDAAPSARPLADRRGILLVGSYQHAPNVEALEWFGNEILPKIDPKLLTKHPIYIVGNGLEDAHTVLVPHHPALRWVGWVPEVTPYFHQARLSVIPLRTGAGTKRKMIQALMHGTPTVSTTIGTEGLDLVSGTHVLETDDPAAFAHAIEQLLSDDLLSQKLAGNGLQHIAASRGRDVVRKQFHRVLKSVLEAPAKTLQLPEPSLERYWRRINGSHARQIAAVLRQTLDQCVPVDATLAVPHEGSLGKMHFRTRVTLPFPMAEDGTPRSEWFADTDAFLNHVDFIHSQGADYLLLPKSIIESLDPQYAGWGDRMTARFRVIADDTICRIYALNAIADDPRIVSVPESVTAVNTAVKLIAFYLPQYHPIPENDAWWGQGFTEWRNVGKAKPLFAGHQQPQLPRDLGFYDLRLAETRQQQADLARRHGIHGFCYYHYWFQGKRLLERPFDDVLQSGRLDFPFCLCWANEPWSRRWDGSDHDVLQAQTYSAEDDLAHIRWLLKPLADPRAIHIQGRPVFMVYRADLLPEPRRTTDLWRREAERAGLPGLYLLAVETGWDAGWDATAVGFDAKVLFQPQFSLLGTVPRLDVGPSSLRVFDYDTAWPVLAHPPAVSYPRYDTVFPGWDNTARKGNQGWVVHNNTPAAYREWLALAIQRAMLKPTDERVVFINAWNEWAEGAHLEPDRTHGRGFLEATRAAITAVRSGQ